jgi:hypothetical protein
MRHDGVAVFRIYHPRFDVDLVQQESIRLLFHCFVS